MPAKVRSHVDFIHLPAPTLLAKATHAVATAADDQEDYFWSRGVDNTPCYFEHKQTAANAAIFYTKQTAAPFGWKCPLDNNDADGIEITQGIVNAATQMEFVANAGQAFYLKATFDLATRAGTDVMLVGFRQTGAYVDITTGTGTGAGTVAAAYAECAYLGIHRNTGALYTVTAKAGPALTETALAHAAWADGETHTLEVYVSAAGAVTYKIDGAADANAVAFTFTATTALVPSIVLVATGGGDPVIVIQEYDCGHQ